MTNPTIEKTQEAVNSVRDTAREGMRPVRDTVRTGADRLQSMDANEMMDQAGDTASEFYGQASTWVRDNSRTLYMVGGFLAVGLVGYFLGRNFVSRSSNSGDPENY